MPTIKELRDRSDALFTSLFRAEAGEAGLAAAPGGARGQRPFSWFDPDQARAATQLSAVFAIRSGARRGVNAGLSAALDAAEEAVPGLGSGVVREALSLLVTHHRPARRLLKPRAVAADARRFVGSQRPRQLDGFLSAAEADLDYWREDTLANEHHSHWHQVYPFSGLLPTDWDDWATNVSRPGAAVLLEVLDPAPDWPTLVVAMPVAQLRDEFLSRATQLTQQQLFEFFAALPKDGYRALFRMNDRQGELFFYMHQQMLARYDAERLSHGLPVVKPFGPTQWSQPISDGYDPMLGDPYGKREPGQQLPSADVTALKALDTELDTALAAGELLGAAAAGVPLDRTLIGEAVEAAEGRLLDLRAGRYLGLHNIGHGRIASLSDGFGVMNDPSVAIRDPIFWRWHRYIDGLGDKWQKAQPPDDLSDGPPVTVRNTLTGALTPWKSPDIVLLDLSGVADHASFRTAVAAALVANWDQDLTNATLALGDGTDAQCVSELRTRMRDGQLADGTPVEYLTHDAFAYTVRVENPGASRDITLRVFLAPRQWTERRRMWIELDKFIYTAPTGRSVAYRADTEVSVIKKPSETDPSQTIPGDARPGDEGYCDCGWPYPLLLPRGTAAGLASRIIVLCSDTAIDNASPEPHCGSMSFCGAVDRYPDARDMGYPFSRPFSDSIAKTFVALANAAGRGATIKHATA